MFKSMHPYRKLPDHLGFVLCHKLFKGSANLSVRTHRGHMDIAANEETVLLIGAEGEVHALKFERFLESYSLTGQAFKRTFELPPTVLIRGTGACISLMDHVEACLCGGSEECVRALCLTEPMTLKASDGSKRPSCGEPGDWLVARSEDELYIVSAGVFENHYIKDYSGEDISYHSECLRVTEKDAQMSHEALVEAIRQRAEVFRLHVGALRFPRPLHALRMEHPFAVTLPGETGVLRGEPGDWLLQLAPGVHKVVPREVFGTLYQVSDEY